MPDICLCENNKCSRRNKCFRYRAMAAEYWQSWSYFNKDKPPKAKCRFYWKMSKATSPCLTEEEAEARGRKWQK